MAPTWAGPRLPTSAIWAIAFRRRPALELAAAPSNLAAVASGDLLARLDRSSRPGDLGHRRQERALHERRRACPGGDRHDRAAGTQQAKRGKPLGHREGP